jgi:hypothetical protein
MLSTVIFLGSLLYEIETFNGRIATVFALAIKEGNFGDENICFEIWE